MRKMEMKINNKKTDFPKADDFSRTIIDGIKDEVILINPENRKILYANKPVLDRTGLSQFQLRKKNCHDW